MSNADTSLTRLGTLDTALLSDALDAIGLPGGTGAIRAQTQPAQLHGRVRTVELGPWVQGRAPGPHIATTAVATAQPGDVIVVANQGRTDVSCWGGLLSLGSQLHGVRGVIADGLCRDIAEARDLLFPVFSRGATPRTARNRLQQVASGAPVVIDGIPVDDGDYVLGDECGVVFITGVSNGNKCLRARIHGRLPKDRSTFGNRRRFSRRRPAGGRDRHRQPRPH